MAAAQAISAARRKMTEEESLRLPDDGHKWELVDGEAREAPAGRSLRQASQLGHGPSLHHGQSSGGGCTP